MQHKNWRKLTLFQQLGNIGSAFMRAVKSKNFDEVLELLDLTISDKRWVRGMKELTRLREVICDLMTGSSMYEADPKVLDRYFLGFAILARMGN